MSLISALMSTQVDLLKKYNLSVRGHVGQHLLIDPNIQRKIVDLLELKPTDRVLEIGPGLGALTNHLLGRCEKLIAVEMDETFVEILKKEFIQKQGTVPPQKKGDSPFFLIHADILKTDLASILGKSVKKPWKAISNLPYYITAPILFHLLESRAYFSKLVLMMQKEVADRLLASPGSKDYGRLTLAMRYAGTIRHAFDVPPSCFAPRPAVSSSVVVLDLYPPKQLLKKKEEENLFYLIKIAFSQRRKMFLSLLAADPELGKSRPELEAVFKKQGISLQTRGEQLLLKDYMGLVQALCPS